MKIRPVHLAVGLSTALVALAGCERAGDGSGDVPFAGTSTSTDAADTAEKVSSGLYDLIGVKGKASDSHSTVVECSGRNAEEYFRILHPWSFVPADADDLGVAMEQLERGLPEHGWKIRDHGLDTSKNKNLRMTADHDGRKVSVRIIEMAKGTRRC